jgi:hypothetical protein
VTRELLTTTDVALVLGVSRRRAAWLADNRPGFPEPYAATPAGVRLWRRADVERWAATADRTAGRPRDDR